MRVSRWPPPVASGRGGGGGGDCASDNFGFFPKAPSRRSSVVSRHPDKIDIKYKLVHEYSFQAKEEEEEKSDVGRKSFGGGGGSGYGGHGQERQCSVYVLYIAKGVR